MGYQRLQASVRAVVELAIRQHGVVSRQQLLALGMHPQTIKHRVARGRLFVVHRGVYAVGTPVLTQEGKWMAAVLACGEGAVLSHGSAAALWGLPRLETWGIEVSVAASRSVQRTGIRVHRRAVLASADRAEERRIPVTNAYRTIVDVAGRLGDDRVARLVSDADARNLIDADDLRRYLATCPKQRGLTTLRRVLDPATFVLTKSELERYFLPIVRRLGLPKPLSGAHVDGYEVDFYWPELGLVVETDGLRYHRTPTQQTRDRVRDQAHTAAGLTPLRFTHHQVRYESASVEETLRATAERIKDR